MGDDLPSYLPAVVRKPLTRAIIRKFAGLHPVLRNAGLRENADQTRVLAQLFEAAFEHPVGSELPRRSCSGEVLVEIAQGVVEMSEDGLAQFIKVADPGAVFVDLRRGRGQAPLPSI